MSQTCPKDVPKVTDWCTGQATSGPARPPRCGTITTSWCTPWRSVPYWRTLASRASYFGDGMLLTSAKAPLGTLILPRLSVCAFLFPPLFLSISCVCVCVCVCVCGCERGCVCAHACACLFGLLACVHVSVGRHTHACLFGLLACVHVSAGRHTHVCLFGLLACVHLPMCPSMRVCMHVCVCMCVSAFVVVGWGVPIQQVC